MSTDEFAPHVRCGDVDRQAVATRLDEAFALGRISRDEHDERVAGVWRARTFGDLSALVADLGALPHATSAAQVAWPASTSPAVPGPVMDLVPAGREHDRIVSVLGEHRRQGVWRLRPSTTGAVVMADVKLDLRQAVFEAAECVIAVPCVMGDVKIWVPDGVEVRDETTTVLGDVKLLGMGRPSPGGPRIVLRGLVLMGSIKVFGPDHVSLAQRLGLG